MNEPVGVTVLKAFAYKGRMCMPEARFSMPALEATAYSRRGFVALDKVAAAPVAPVVPVQTVPAVPVVAPTFTAAVTPTEKPTAGTSADDADARAPRKKSPDAK